MIKSIFKRQGMKFYRYQRLQIILFSLTMINLVLANEELRIYPIGNDIIWENIGPGGGGSVFGLAINPKYPNLMLAGADGGPILRTEDGGQTWKAVGIDNHGYYAPLVILRLKFSEQQPNRAYACSYRGLFESTDYGKNFKCISLNVLRCERLKRGPKNPVVGSMAIDPSDGDVLYMGRGWIYGSTGGVGEIYKTTDRGKTWALINNGIPPEAVIHAIEVDPHDSQIVYVSTDEGFFKSVDGGQHWQKLTTGLPHNNLRDLALHYDADTKKTTLYLTVWPVQKGLTRAVNADEWCGGVFKSIDRGERWIVKNNGLAKHVNTNVNSYHGMTCYRDIIVSPHSPDIVYVQTQGESAYYMDKGKRTGVWKSIDGGNNWRCLTPQKMFNFENGGWLYYWIVTGNGLGLAISHTRPETVAFARSMVCLLEDGGSVFRQIYTEPVEEKFWRGRGIELTHGMTALVDPSDNQCVYLGFGDVGLFRSDDGCQSFTRMSRQYYDDARMEMAAHITYLYIDPDNPAMLYAGTGRSKIFRTLDKGETWEKIFDMKGYPRKNSITGIAVSQSELGRERNIYISALDKGVFKSTDDGKTWESIGKGLSKMVYHLMLTKSGKLLAATDRGIYRYEYRTQIWESLSKSIEPSDVRKIVVHPKNENIIYAAVRAPLKNLSGGGVFKSTDRGNTWVRVLHVPFCEALAISPFDPEVIYAGSNEYWFYIPEAEQMGIFKSSNGGQNWTRENIGFNTRYWIYDITIDPIDPSILYLGNRNSGFYKGIDQVIRKRKVQIRR